MAPVLINGIRSPAPVTDLTLALLVKIVSILSSFEHCTSFLDTLLYALNTDEITLFLLNVNRANVCGKQK